VTDQVAARRAPDRTFEIGDRVTDDEGWTGSVTRLKHGAGGIAVVMVKLDTGGTFPYWPADLEKVQS
jgi:hypothetical protein